MSGRGNVHSGNCPFGEMSIGDYSVGEMSVGELSSGKCQSGNCPVRELSAYRYKYAQGENLDVKLLFMLFLWYRRRSRLNQLF